MIEKWKKVDSIENIELTGIAVKDRSFIVISGELPWKGDVYCLATTSALQGAKVLWSTQMDAFWTKEWSGTTADFFTECRIRGRTLFLFHCSRLSIGIEALDIDSGVRQFSFNSNWKSLK